VNTTLFFMACRALFAAATLPVGVCRLIESVRSASVAPATLPLVVGGPRRHGGVWACLGSCAARAWQPPCSWRAGSRPR